MQCICVAGSIMQIMLHEIGPQDLCHSLTLDDQLYNHTANSLTVSASPASTFAALPTLDIAEGALNKLIELYKQLLPQMGGYLTYAGDLNHERLQLLLGVLADQELQTLEERAAVRTATACTLPLTARQFSICPKPPRAAGPAGSTATSPHCTLEMNSSSCQHVTGLWCFTCRTLSGLRASGQSVVAGVGGEAAHPTAAAGPRLPLLASTAAALCSRQGTGAWVTWRIWRSCQQQQWPSGHRSL